MDELVFIMTSDFSSRAKGRALRADQFDERTSLGWVPANLGIGPLGHIVEDLPFGASGDLRLLPDLNSRMRVEGVPDKPAVDVVFADIVETDGSPWEACPRTFLRSTIAELEQEFGLSTRVAFEHEFTETHTSTPSHPFSFESFREVEPLGSTLMNVLQSAGIEPETWLPEYGAHQFEITVRPSDPVTAADRAVLLREITREVFESAGRRITFSPSLSAEASGNGVHVHFGLDDLTGGTLMYDPDRPGRLSEQASVFAAGIVKYAPALAAFYAPLTVSYQRLAPHHWSSARAFVGVQNREAMLRICPTNEIDGRDPAPQLHFEFRAGDVGANPWIHIGILLKAGMQGLREGLEPAEIVSGELDLEGAHRHLAPLPSSLSEALEALTEKATIRNWFAPSFLETFEQIKRDELARMHVLPIASQYEVYSNVY